MSSMFRHSMTKGTVPVRPGVVEKPCVQVGFATHQIGAIRNGLMW